MDTKAERNGDFVTKQYAERVKAVASILDVVGDVVQLRRKGNNYLGLCPFHDDQSLGSFFVNEKRNVCTCFACRVTLSPWNFLAKYRGISYPQAIRILGDRYNIRDTSAKPSATFRPIWHNPKPKIQPRRPRQKPYLFNGGKTLLESMAAMDSQTTSDNILAECSDPETPNPLFYFISSQLGDPDLVDAFHDVCKRYCVLTSDGKKYAGTKGWTIYPNMDEAGILLTAKFMRYRYDGHRVKDPTGQHSIYSFDYLHSLEQRAGRLPHDSEISFCLFGLHLRDAFPDAEICICESEKTAIIAQTFSDPRKKLWMATGGKSRLTPDYLRPLASMGRNIVLYPDMDAMEIWTTFCSEYSRHLGHHGYKARIMVARHLKEMHDPEKDGSHADIADILLRQWRERREGCPKNGHPLAAH